nr:MAG TPA: serine/threonine-protein kinase [Caudoviricetes sp.]
MLVWSLSFLINFIIKTERGILLLRYAPFFIAQNFIKTVDIIVAIDYNKKGGV